MANRIVGNVLIVDSAAGNAFVYEGNAVIQAVAIYANDTTGQVQLTTADTRDQIVRVSVGGGPVGFTSGITKQHDFQALRIDDGIKVPVLNAGTAFIYFL